MNAIQQRQWNDFACVSRCLIKLTEIHGQPISTDNYCSQFEQYFPNPSTNYGQLDSAAFFQIVPLLCLPTQTDSTCDYDTALTAFDSGKRLILMISHINLNPGKNDVINHCSVLTKITPTDFCIWTPSQDGTDGPMDFKRADWAAKQCSVIILL